MSISTKLSERSRELVGEEITGAALMVPPGATLYGGYANKGDGQSKAILTALGSKAASSSGGLAGIMPRKQGGLIRTPTRLLFVKLKRLGGAPSEVVAGWTSDQISSITYDPPANGAYPAVSVVFTDDSVVTVYGEKSWGLETLA